MAKIINDNSPEAIVRRFTGQAPPKPKTTKQSLAKARDRKAAKRATEQKIIDETLSGPATQELSARKATAALNKQLTAAGSKRRVAKAPLIGGGRGTRSETILRIKTVPLSHFTERDT